MEVLARINREDRSTVVVSLHQVEYARQFCPRIIALREGVVVYDGAASALSNHKLAEIYGSQTHELFTPHAIEHPRPPEMTTALACVAA